MFNFITLLTIPVFLIDIEIYLLIYTFLFLHINWGLCTIINDYLHLKIINSIFLFLIRISIIEITRYSFELLL